MPIQKGLTSFLFFSTCFSLELRFSEMKRVFATLRALVEVMEALSKDAAPDGVGRLIMEEVLPAIFTLFLARAGMKFHFNIHLLSYDDFFALYFL